MLIGLTSNGTVVPILLEAGINLSYKWLDSRSGAFMVSDNVVAGAFRIDHNGSADGKSSAVYFTEAQIKQESMLLPWTPSPKDKVDVAQVNPLIKGVTHNGADMSNELIPGTYSSDTAIKNGPFNGDTYTSWTVQAVGANVITQTAHRQTGETAHRTLWVGSGWGPWRLIPQSTYFEKNFTAAVDILSLRDGIYYIQGTLPKNFISFNGL
ncbi:hypothetical protein KB236_04520 [Levilactobacillus brevis]|nr:hypothetical protein KB236_04520 [Levilactobacillus brevis]